MKIFITARFILCAVVSSGSAAFFRIIYTSILNIHDRGATYKNLIMYGKAMQPKLHKRYVIQSPRMYDTRVLSGEYIKRKDV